jgi:hypothetical protein
MKITTRMSTFAVQSHTGQKSRTKSSQGQSDKYRSYVTMLAVHLLMEEIAIDVVIIKCLFVLPQPKVG